MNTQLIADAVRNSRYQGKSAFWDRLFAFWFRRLVYTQIWEDPEADLAALRLPIGSTIVTISSGGCNALSYLTARPAQVYAVDLNEAHLSLLNLKLAGLRVFSRYSEFWQFWKWLAGLQHGTLPQPATSCTGCRYARLLGQAQYHWAIATRLFH